MAEVEDDEESIEQALAGVVDPSELDPLHPTHGLVSVAWRFERQLGQAQVTQNLRMVDLGSAETVSYLRENFLPTLHDNPLRGYIEDDLDFSDVMGRTRPLTQAISRFIYMHPADDGTRTAGIRYLSRLNPGWECWALFHDRVADHLVGGFPSEIDPSDPHLLEAARVLGLSIQVIRNHDYCLRPWNATAF
jgi:hypothetical protein